jgi:ABC-2 type transport system permease protein
MMATASKTIPEAAADVREPAPSTRRATRPLYWSLRRELWENRSIYLAPLGIATFAVVGLVIHGITMPSHVPGMLGTDPASPVSASVTYRVAASLMLLTWFVVGAFYCLEALNGERRDRGILFWKSLPVSDLTTVLAKASIPLLVLPLLTFAVIIVMHLAMLLLSAAVLMVQGQSVAALWRELQLFQVWTALLYAVAAITLWHAPIYAFLLLVSGWARRTAALWAVLPLIAISLLEKLTMDTWHFVSLVTYRLVGWYQKAFVIQAPESVPFRPMDSLTPGRLLSTPDLWIGLALAALFIAAAVRLRRYREPV